MSSPAAPRPVQHLVVRHSDETSLSVLWKRPVGEWDSVTVVLRQTDPATIVAQRVLSWEARECTVDVLTPGRLYTVTVATHSGDLSSSASVTARTSKPTSGLFTIIMLYIRKQYKLVNCLIFMSNFICSSKTKQEPGSISAAVVIIKAIQQFK